MEKNKYEGLAYGGLWFPAIAKATDTLLEEILRDYDDCERHLVEEPDYERREMLEGLVMDVLDDFSDSPNFPGMLAEAAEYWILILKSEAAWLFFDSEESVAQIFIDQKGNIKCAMIAYLIGCIMKKASWYVEEGKLARIADKARKAVIREQQLYAKGSHPVNAYRTRYYTRLELLLEDKCIPGWSTIEYDDKKETPTRNSLKLKLWNDTNDTRKKFIVDLTGAMGQCFEGDLGVLEAFLFGGVADGFLIVKNKDLAVLIDALIDELDTDRKSLIETACLWFRQKRGHIKYASLNTAITEAGQDQRFKNIKMLLARYIRKS